MSRDENLEEIAQRQLRGGINWLADEITLRTDWLYQREMDHETDALLGKQIIAAKRMADLLDMLLTGSTFADLQKTQQWQALQEERDQTVKLLQENYLSKIAARLPL